MSSLKRMKIISIIWGMFLVTLFIIVTIFAFKFKNTSKKYLELGEYFSSKAQEYVEDNNLYPSKDETIKVNKSDLIDNEYIEELEIDEDKCEGFVIVTNKKNYEYKAYLKCNKYKSAKYEKMEKWLWWIKNF